MPRKSLEDETQTDHKSDSNSGEPGRPLQPEITISSQTEIGQTEESIDLPNLQEFMGRKPVTGETGETPLQPKVGISSQTEIGQTEESVKVPNQQAYTGSELVISSSLADTPCSSLGLQGLLDSLNATLGTSYTLDTPTLSSVLEDCIAQNYDFGTAYGRLRSSWRNQRYIQLKLWECETKGPNRPRHTRRLWDLYSNRVVPSWCCRLQDFDERVLYPISHAWVNEVDRVNVWTPINGYEWPVPIPKGANLDLIRIEMLNLGAEYTWLDVLCLRQKGGPREDLRVKEWELDVPNIGAIYQNACVVCYLSGLGLPLSLKEGDLESDRCWFRRAWTVQEVGNRRIIAGDIPDGPLNTEPTDEVGNFEDKKLTKFHKQLESAEMALTTGLYGVLSTMQDRVSTYPVDKVAGLVWSLGVRSKSVPAYYENQSLEDAWTALINVMGSGNRGILFFTYPEPGTGHKKWRPSWEQVMTKSKSLPEVDWYFRASVGRHNDDWYAGQHVERGLFVRSVLLPDGDRYIPASVGRDDDWYDGWHIERGFVHGLAVGGVEGIDRRGELVVEDANGKAHSFNIVARHQYPIPKDTYTLLGNNELVQLDETQTLQYWVVGRRLPSERFEKVSVLRMATTLNEMEQLMKLIGIKPFIQQSIHRRSILA
ncbi:hypothetical protein EV421DRAFT_100804 [Armillaria borealis]|uniref:Heterokaryon incompatibility domain-containing protein n=1 Tax=Armillaria borealis TaxID=47425 RepID=A0AA39N4B2_9AGAR|nr:hypothetical protein EV421DRAFT_100804 [Armillaria borealis]